MQNWLPLDRPMEDAPMNRYQRVITHIFQKFSNGTEDFEFPRSELVKACETLGIKRIDNPGDIIYTYRYRQDLPKPILDTQPKGLYWLILGAGPARYRFHLGPLLFFKPTPGLTVRKIPDATPEIISKYALTDEQSLLAKIRYNRLIDAFLGIVGYSLQNHLRTNIENYGQIEIDELYVGVNSRGEQFIVPVQAKGGDDRLGVIQTIQDSIYCGTQKNYRDANVRPVSAQFMSDDVIALFELYYDQQREEVTILRQRHYKLTAAGEISQADLKAYKADED